MLVAYEEFGNELKYSKNDIDILINQNKILDNITCNERGCIILWDKKYITTEKFADLMDIEYIDNEFWMVFDGFDDVLSNKIYETEIKTLSGEMDWEGGNYYDADVKSYWGDYDETTLKRLIEFCVDKGIEINDELMTKENTIIKDKDIYFNDKKLVDFIDDDDLYDLKNTLNNSICEAQESAEMSEVYKKTVESFEESIGEFKWETIKKDGKDVEKLFIKVNVDFNDIDYYLKDLYGEYEFEEESFGSLYHILNEMDFFEFSVPDYRYIYNSIDDDELNDITRNRLDWD